MQEIPNTHRPASQQEKINGVYEQQRRCTTLQQGKEHSQVTEQ